jgi:two-component system sensor histidine kinase ChvG
LPKSDDQKLSLRWTGRISITARILAINIFALGILAGSLFYLDSYRKRITEARVEQAETEARIIATALAAAPPAAARAAAEAGGAGIRGQGFASTQGTGRS